MKRNLLGKSLLVLGLFLFLLLFYMMNFYGYKNEQIINGTYSNSTIPDYFIVVYRKEMNFFIQEGDIVKIRKYNLSRIKRKMVWRHI